MSKLSAFIKDLKKSKVKEEPKEEAKPKAKPPVYVARRPHAKTQKRNENFAEFVISDEAKELIKDVKNTQKLKTLVNAFKEKYSETIPLVTAYSIYNQIQK